MHDTWKSKKLWFSIGVIALAFVYALLAATFVPNLGSYFDGFTGILEFIAGAYLTGNIANKFVVGKAGATVVDPKPAVKPPAKAPPGGPKPPDEDE